MSVVHASLPTAALAPYRGLCQHSQSEPVETYAGRPCGATAIVRRYPWVESTLHQWPRMAALSFAFWQAHRLHCSGSRNSNRLSKLKARTRQSCRTLARATTRIEFPKGFLWGAATASFQIEGAAESGGKGLSIWDEFAHLEGTILDGESIGDACGHYERFEEDVELIASLGLRAYRFSISWPRVLPQGTLEGGVNEMGIIFYERLCGALRARDIEPMVTLYHWDLPAALEAQGGWLHRSTADHFEDFARLCFRRLGPYVRYWTTINEPWTQCVLGYALGIHAPGRRSQPGVEPYLAGHHMLLAHAQAVKAFREIDVNSTGQIGIALNSEWFEPMEPDSAADRDAQQRQLSFHLGWFADPVFFGEYPEEMRRKCGDRLPSFSPEEREALRGSCDFFSLNTYSARYVGCPSPLRTLAALPGTLRSFSYLKDQLHRLFRPADPGFPAPEEGAPSYFADYGGDATSTDAFAELSAMGWAVAPWGLGRLLCHVQERYSPKGGIYVTENGIALDFGAPEEARTHFFERHAAALHSAQALGADVRGYFAWSLMDNFEWVLGTSKRFGLVEVDFKTFERRERPCCEWYRRLCRENAMVVEVPLYERILERG